MSRAELRLRAARVELAEAERRHAVVTELEHNISEMKALVASKCEDPALTEQEREELRANWNETMAQLASDMEQLLDEEDATEPHAQAKDIDGDDNDDDVDDDGDRELQTSHEVGLTRMAFHTTPTVSV